MDFNCLIYYCIPHVPVTNTFEVDLIEAVIVHLTDIVGTIRPTAGVSIAIDGVVPMAKMRQQRLRRFKSVWETKPMGKEKKWDTNAITPGTLFMDNLCSRLSVLCEKMGWLFSGSDEPGEGEHKLMALWRSGYNGTFAVYGMDADLIVLSLLAQEQNGLGAIWLFREADATKAEATKADATKADTTKAEATKNVYEWFSINHLKTWILTQLSSTCILSYCFAMSVLGNDFLPSSLGLKMRDGGHDELLRYLTQPLIVDDQIVEENLMELFHQLAQFEPHRIAKYIRGKQHMAQRCTDKALGELNWPLSCIEEGLIGPMWETTYLRYFDHTPEEVCADYWRGIRWIWLYYTGKPVCYNWFYPHILPPLWKSITRMECIPEICVEAKDIRPVEQLALVLPLESWSLIPPCKERMFPAVAPQFFPSSFQFDAVGKHMFWQCEACIPIPTILELKSLIQA